MLRCGQAREVLPPSRRIFFYWLLLLLPTLAVGAGAILLLRREQARLAERVAYADEAGRAAIAARARLVVENVELLVGDVQTGLLDVLAAVPATTLDHFLEQWPKKNPLVRGSFRASLDGTVLWPDAETAGEEGRGFLRRLSEHFGQRAPWTIAATVPPPALQKNEQEQLLAGTGRKEIAANVAQVQSARRDVQELFKSGNVYTSSAAPAPSSPLATLADGSVSADDRARQKTVEVERRAMPSSRPTDSRRVSLASSSTASPLEVKSAQFSAPSVMAKKDGASGDRSGWLPANVDGRLHLFGWLQPGGRGDIRGVEVDVIALISRLGAALPVAPTAGEGYALRDGQGRVLHQAGAVAVGGAAMVRVPLASALLPNWEVTAYLLPLAQESGGGGFFGISVLLVAILVVAILTGGLLLLRQARLSEEEAAQKTSFVANVSHEFKTPLTTIRLYAELLEQGRVRDAAQGGDYLRTIGKETQRLARLVNNALDFSRLEQGKKRFSPEAFDVGVEIGSLLDAHLPRVAEVGLALRRELPARPLMVTTDRDALGQIILNLVDNACKYAIDGGEVRVALISCAGGGAEVRVADRGPGVPSEHRERIFEKFHRVNETLTAEKNGTGLGLSIARQLARGLGGELRYAPRSGGGAEFILSLP